MSAVFFLLLVVLTCFWNILIIIHAIKTWREYKLYKTSNYFDYQIRKKILSNFKTILIKDLMLILLSIFEFSVPLYLGLPTTIIMQYIERHEQYIEGLQKSGFGNCSIDPILALVYFNPFILLAPISFGVFLNSSMVLLLGLSAYLTRKYQGYSLEKGLIYRISFWLLCQNILLFSSLIPYLQVLILLLPISLTLFNWGLLVRASRKLSRAIKSKLFEVYTFEFDPLLYRKLKNSYRNYNIFISFHLMSLFLLIVVICITIVFFSLNPLLSSSCYLETVYGIQLSIPSSIQDVLMNRVTGNFFKYALFSVEVVYTLFLIIPWLVITILYLSHAAFKRGRNNLFDFNHAMIQPLLN